jgi:hypothetical protein
MHANSGNEPVYPKGDNMGENIGNALGGKNLNLRSFFLLKLAGKKIKALKPKYVDESQLNCVLKASGPALSLAFFLLLELARARGTPWLARCSITCSAPGFKLHKHKSLDHTDPA